MTFILGGRHMGKLAYAQSLVGNPVVCNLEKDPLETIAGAAVVLNVHLFVRQILLSGGNPAKRIPELLPALSDKIVIGEEIGSGVVPMEPFEREWRDETGRVYQLLAMEATEVIRVWAGIPQVIKSQR